MKVYIITALWSTPTAEGHELVQCFRDEIEAKQVFREMALSNKRELENDFGYIWNDDYTMEDDCYISFGFYGESFEPDTIYTWELIEMEVE